MIMNQWIGLDPLLNRFIFPLVFPVMVRTAKLRTRIKPCTPPIAATCQLPPLTKGKNCRCHMRSKGSSFAYSGLQSGQRLPDIEKLLKSQKTTYIGGAQGLQACRAHAIESHLKMVVRNGRQWADASECSTEMHGFSVKWRGWQLHSWSNHWIKTRELPKLLRGQHGKVYLLLSNPAVSAELRAYVRSNEWAMNPG
jgi:hypothetical protein